MQYPAVPVIYPDALGLVMETSARMTDVEVLPDAEWHNRRLDATFDEIEDDQEDQ